jgi:hypothetical protein
MSFIRNNHDRRFVFSMSMIPIRLHFLTSSTDWLLEHWVTVFMLIVMIDHTLVLFLSVKTDSLWPMCCISTSTAIPGWWYSRLVVHQVSQRHFKLLLRIVRRGKVSLSMRICSCTLHSWMAFGHLHISWSTCSLRFNSILSYLSWEVLLGWTLPDLSVLFAV